MVGQPLVIVLWQYVNHIVCEELRERGERGEREREREREREGKSLAVVGICNTQQLTSCYIPLLELGLTVTQNSTSVDIDTHLYMRISDDT